KAFLGGKRVKEFDALLHTERRAARQTHQGSLPNWTMVEHEGAAFAVNNHKLLLWSFSGYSQALLYDPIKSVKLLTPPSIIAILAKGYKPRWHESAKQWDAT
ncbi:MAG: hypothetical protein KGO94_11210, partial [Alphaproteobacteria bacterium]|nr:hypothetical protein [Alphaproteobacteria bacterium]